MVGWQRVPAALAAKLKAMRQLLGLSQEDVARQAGISQGAVSRMESGECAEMSFHTVAAIVGALVVELAPLVERCSDDIRQLITVTTACYPMLVENQTFTVLADPGLEMLVRTYTAMDATQRRQLVRLITPIIDLVRSGTVP